MNIDIFAEIKSRLSITDVCANYGIDIKHRGENKLFARCCFHKEKTASLAIYPETNSFYCYGCGSGGDILTFVEKLFNLDPLETAWKLNEDFHLGIDVKKPPDKEQIQAAVNDRKLLETFESWINTAYITLCDYFHLLGSFKEQYTPKTPDEAYSNLFVESCHNLNYIEWLIDSLMFADFTKQLQFYKEYRKEVESIAVRVDAHRKDRSTKTA